MTDITKNISEEQLQYIYYMHDEKDLTWAEMTEEFNRKFNTSLSRENIRYRIRKRRKGSPSPVLNNSNSLNSTTINSDGTQVSQIKIRMTADQSKNPDYVLSAHGYDPKLWKIKQATSNVWEQNNSEQGLVQLYQSKIVVEPITEPSIEFILSKLTDEVKPIRIESIKTGNHNLIINLADVHMGIVDYEYMQPAQNEIINIISRGYKTICINLIGDLIHNDSIVNPLTTRGTLVDQVDMIQAIEDLKRYIEPMIETASANCNTVKVYYVPGNHDLSISYMFMQYLMMRFKDIHFDGELKHRKAYMLDEVLIGIAHGDLARKNLPMLLATEFPELWGKACTREYFVGHFHSEKKEVTTPVQDKDGVTVRQMGTLKKSDYFEKKNGYVGSRKKLQLFEYNSRQLKVTYEI